MSCCNNTSVAISVVSIRFVSPYAHALTLYQCRDLSVLHQSLYLHNPS